MWLLQSVLEGISRDAGFKSEVLKAQDMHHTTLNRESERLANDVSKVRSEIRCGWCQNFAGVVSANTICLQRFGQVVHLLATSGQHQRVSTWGHSALRIALESRYEVEKLTASQRLDLNLEKGRMRDELQVGLHSFLR